MEEGNEYLGYIIKQWKPLTQTWDNISFFIELPPNPIRIRVDSLDVPWVINVNGEIFQYIDGVWIQNKGYAVDLAV